MDALNEVKYVMNKGNVLLSDILSGTEPKGNVLITAKEPSKPAPMPPPAPSSHKDLKRILREGGVQIIDEPDYMPEVIIEGEEPDEEYGLDTSNTHHGLPAYNMKQTTIRADPSVFTKINSMIMSYPHYESLFKQLRRELIKIRDTTYLGAYNVVGQFKRLVKQQEVHNYSKAYHTEKWPTDFEGVEKLMTQVGKYFPLSNTNLKLPTTTEEISMTAEQASDHKLAVPKINATAEAGPPYASTVKKRDTARFDAMAYPNVINKRPRQWERWVRIKEKKEVYDLADANEKLRNIAVYNSATTLPMIAVMQLLNDGIKSVGWASIAGKSFVHGNAAKMLNYIRKEKKGAMIFSDNIFLFAVEDKLIKIRSLDGVKMEASHSSRDSAGALIMMAGIISPTSDRTAIEKLAERARMTAISPNAKTHGICIKYPGLGSGWPGTFMLNHLAMARAAVLIEDMIEAPDDEINKVIKKLGLQLETTRTSGLRLAEFKAWDVKDIDFLGYCLGRVPTEHGPNAAEAPVLILQRERLLKAMLYDKSKLKDTRMETATNPEVARLRVIANKLGKLITLYLIGGFYYKDTRLYLDSMFQETVLRVTNTDELYRIFEIITSDADDEELLAPSLVIKALVDKRLTIWLAITLHTRERDTTTAKDILKKVNMQKRNVQPDVALSLIHI